MAVAYGCAFWSLYDQAPGLVGEHGIYHFREVLQQQWRAHGGLALWHVPSLLWLAELDLWGSDALLRALAVAGGVSATLLAVGVAARSAAVACWICYLSFTAVDPGDVGGGFFAWAPDQLTLEVGFLLPFVLPGGMWSGSGRREPPVWARWLVWWVAFRVMFGCGVAKLLAGDPRWLDLSAVATHLQTLPFPSATTPWFAALPPWVLAALTAFVLVVEVVLPWLYFVAGWPRRVAALAGLVLMVGIAASANYRWLNLVTAGVLLTLLDDRFLGRAAAAGRSPAVALSPRFAWVLVPLLGGIGLARQIDQVSAVGAPRRLETAIERAVEPLHLVGHYNLFARVVSERLVLVFEGTTDGVQWHEYEVAGYPGPLQQAPRQYGPYHRYLNFNLWWLAAAPPHDHQAFFAGLVRGLLQARPEVLALFATAPFGDQRPTQVRIRRYRYRFANADERSRGAVWSRTPVDAYVPAVRWGGGGVQLVGAARAGGAAGG